MTVLSVPPWVTLLLLTGAALAMLIAAAMLIADRHRRQQIERARARPSPQTPLDVLLTPKTDVIPVIVPRDRPAGALFTPSDGPLTPEPGAPYPGEES